MPAARLIYPSLIILKRAGKGPVADGLVLVGGLGYVRVSSVAGICPRDIAALLRSALLRLESSSTSAVEDGAQVGGLPLSGHESRCGR